jgi:Methyltransferase domain
MKPVQQSLRRQAVNLEVYLSRADRLNRKIAPLGYYQRPLGRWNGSGLEISHMASWLVKAMVQRSIGALPYPHFWNGLLQDWVTHSTRLTDEIFFENLSNCGIHFTNLQRYNSTTLRSFSAFELGTGWFPVVPIGLFLCGAREVWTWDIAPLLKLDRLKCVIARFLELEQKQLLKSHLDALPERLALLKEVMTRCDSPQTHEAAQLLERLNIHYRIGNATRSGLPPASIDLIVSDVVLEHPSPAQLTEILHEFRRIAAPEAVMSHSIALDDQYSGRDPRITQFNFLRFSDRMWRWINNPIIPLNRLRISDYGRLFSESGFQIVEETSRRGDPAELARIPLAKRFQRYPIEDLLVTYTRLVAIPRKGDSSKNFWHFAR